MNPETIKANFDETKQSQLPFVEMLINMGYTYLSREDVLRERRNDSSKFLLKEIAFERLTKINSYEVDDVRYPFSDSDVRNAIEELENTPFEGLIDTSQNVYNTIMPTAGGKTIKVFHDGVSSSYNFKFIDFEHPENNAFHVTVEYEASGKANIRPDIVCFVNGIPFVIIENKKSSVATDEALAQMHRNQTPEYCPKLYVFPQLLIGTNGKDMRYGTTGTPPKFYATWREVGANASEIDTNVQKLIQQEVDGAVYAQLLTDLNGATFGHKQVIDRLSTPQDISTLALMEPMRLLDLTKNFILFDAGIKKVSRYQQYFAIKKMLDRVEKTEQGPEGERRQGGLVWHTQGSGKSLTMVMFVKALIEDPHIKNPRVLIVTDRKDLDKQISDTFRACNLKKDVIRASTSQQLLDLIESKEINVVTTLVQKFKNAGKKKNFIDLSKDIFVLIDEAHRTEGGIANMEMSRIIPNACFIAFTGTPLMAKERASYLKFGGYIDKYTIDDALRDKIILPLIYEGRYVELTQNAKQIDRRMERLTEGLNDEQKKQLAQHVTSRIIANNPARIVEIANDIEAHYMKEFQGTGLKAQIVAPSKYSAILFQKFFEIGGKVQTAVVISDDNGIVSEEDTHKKEVADYLKTIDANHRNLESYERSVVDSFKNNEDGIEILIVVDKLLTGFDAPRNTVLYLAKDLKDHNLLQAIARVNRLFENKKLPKTVGYVIDYSENAKNLKTAMKLFGNFEEGDMENTLIDVSEKVSELEASYGALHDMFKELSGSRDDEAYMEMLKSDEKREDFYAQLNDFIRVFKECMALQDFVHEFKHIDTYTRELKKFMEMRKAVALRYADRVDLSIYKQSLINILDKYVDAEGVELLTVQVNISDAQAFTDAVETLGTDKSKAEAIAAQTERTIMEKIDQDPEFYLSFSKKIKEILDEMHAGKMADIEALKQLKQTREDVLEKKDDSIPESVAKVVGADVFYRNLSKDFAGHNLKEEQIIDAVLGIHETLKGEMIVDWYRNSEVKRIMRNKIDDYLYDVIKGKMGVTLSNEEMKAIVEKVLLLAENNHDIFGV